MGLTEFVFLGLPGLETRFEMLVGDRTIDINDYFVPIFTINRKGDVKNLWEDQGTDYDNETLDMVMAVPTEERWSFAYRLAENNVADHTFWLMNELSGAKNTPTSRTDKPTLVEAISEDGHPACVLTYKDVSKKLTDTGCSAFLGYLDRDIPDWRINQALALGNCLDNMDGCFCKLAYDDEYLITNYVLPGEDVNAISEDAVMLFVDIHR